MPTRHAAWVSSWGCVFTLLTTAFLATPAFAQIVTMFDNFDVGDGYDTAMTNSTADWDVDYASSGLTLDVDLALAFNAVGSGYDAISIELGLTLEYGDNEVDIEVREDDNGAPGATIESWHLSGALTPAPFGGVLAPPVIVSSTTLSLTDGALYWVFVSTPGPNDTRVRWHWNSIGSMTLQATQQGFVPGFKNPWEVYISQLFASPVMRVQGINRTVATRPTTWSRVKALY